jgi:hypothetical protein
MKTKLGAGSMLTLSSSSALAMPTVGAQEAR